ncbi:MAG: DHA2 family efflux MFS transporter permease subunit [Deltaproteobacteria bacterium]|jgi:DHA2 family multidrug resistance protein|nr:DHA2 family efflux MFS transporter permease subunit [Deltaproteobacteria bacterium]
MPNNSSPGSKNLPPLTNAELKILSIALPLATFMQVIDITIANVAVPTISGNLGSSYSQGTWILTSYSVANAVVLPLTGKLSQKFGEVRLFLWSTALFTLSSFLCGLAPDLTILVLFRVIQGAAGGPMLPLAQSLLMNNYPKEKQVMALALWTMTVSIAPVCGPVLGGVISDNLNWSWLFFINIPFGFLIIILVYFTLGDRETPKKPAKWSIINFGFLAIGVGSLQMLLDRGKELDWFNSNFILSLLVLSVMGLTFLILWERHNPDPLIDLSLFKSRNFSVGASLFSLGMMLYLGTVVLLPLLLQNWFSYTATWAGLASAPVGLVPFLSMPLIGRYCSKHNDLRPIISFSFLIFASCMLMRSSFAPNADLKFVLVPQFIQGFGLAMFFVPVTALTFIGIHPEKMATAAGIVNCIRGMFGGIGASVITTLWERREAFHHTRLSSYVDGVNPVVNEVFQNIQISGITEDVQFQYLAREITHQSFVLSASEIYKASAVAFLIMITITWCGKPRSN